MSDQHDCRSCPVALICPDNLEKHGIKITGGASPDIEGTSAGDLMAMMLNNIERFQSRLELWDWYCWHAARSVVKSRELRSGKASNTAISYFIQSIIEMMDVFELANGFALISDSDRDRIEITYRMSLLFRSPEDVAANSMEILEMQIAKYAEISANDPMVNMALRVETAVFTVLTVRALMEADGIRDLDGHPVPRS